MTRLDIGLDAVVKEFASQCPLLEEVILDNCGLGDEAVGDLVSKCQQLRKFSLVSAFECLAASYR